jgi:hypothetical protein
MAKSNLHAELQVYAKNYLYNKGYWICGMEVPMPLGICDAWGMCRSAYQTDGESYPCMAIEVKVSRSDFRSKSQLYKEKSSTPLGNYQYVLCPAGMIQPHECHEEWGLLWWGDGRMVNKKRAPRMEMTAQQKLDVLIYFLNNGANVNRPQLNSMPTQETLINISE